jgi:hypothetical protein
MFDHMIILREDRILDLLKDFYGLHVKFSKLLGPRSDAAGNTRWQFGFDPAMAGGREVETARFFILRTIAPELEAVARDLGSSLAVEIPVAAGEMADIAITLSLRGKKHGGERERFDRAALERRLHTVLETAGIEGDSLVIQDIDHRRVHIDKGRDKFLIPAVRVRATGRVKDLNALNSAVRQGVGRDRAYGFGLVAVSKAETGA